MKRGRIAYSGAELTWLSDNRTLALGDCHAAFCLRFQRDDVAAIHLHGLRKRKGWKTGRTPGEAAKLRKGRALAFSDDEIAWCSENRALPIAAFHAGFCARFGRQVTAQSLNALRKRRGWKTGRTGQFAKGHVSANKGKPQKLHPNSARTAFRKGQIPHNTHALGHEVTRDGYVWISVAQRNPYTGAPHSYVQKHRWLWEKAHGPIPRDMALKCLGDRGNADPSNWALVPRGLLPRLNGKSGRGFDAAPAGLKPTIMAIARLEHRARERKAAA